METKYDKMEEEKQKSILEYISLCNKEESQSKIKPEKKEKPKISLIIPNYNGENKFQ